METEAAYERRPRIAICQYTPEAHTYMARNFECALEMVRDAVRQGADLVVLPEYALGIPPSTQTAMAHGDQGVVNGTNETAREEGADEKGAEEGEGGGKDEENAWWVDEGARYRDRWCGVARDLNVNLVPGTICEWDDASTMHNDDGEAGSGNVNTEKETLTQTMDTDTVPMQGLNKVVQEHGPKDLRTTQTATKTRKRKHRRLLSNNAYYISRAGEILCTYKKRNLWHSERDSFTKGIDAHQVFETTEFGKTALLICWDLAFPESFRSLVQQGVKTVIAPTCWTAADAGRGVRYNKDSEAAYLNALCILRAFESEIVFVFCNIGAAEGNALGGVGLSQICAPFYGQVAGFSDARKGVIVADVDYSCLNVAESVYKIRKDLASADWHYDRQRQSHMT